MTEAKPQFDLPDEVPNYERGCKFLDHGSTYLRTDVEALLSTDGDIPTFVEFKHPVPYREGHFRTFKRINGDEFLLEATQGTGALTAEEPTGEVFDHIERVARDNPDDDQAGGIRSIESFDLLMHVGGSYYEEPEDFIREARTQGVSKKIPVSGNQEPPVIRPLRTRLFLIHPKAIPTGLDEDGEELDIGDGEDQDDWDDQVFVPGIIGYTYLTRAIHTRDVDGEVPAWAEEYQDRGLLDVVDVGDQVSYDDDEHPEGDDE